MIATFALSCALAACGGGGGGGGGGAAAGGGQTVSLTGVVATGTQVPGTNIPVGALPASGVWMGAGPQSLSRLANITVLAVDIYGNMKQTTTDAYGNFTLALEPGRSYALLFLDLKRIMQGKDPVIGSLVKSNAPNQAATLALQGKADLGQVIVNPKARKAVSAKEASGQLVGAQLGQAPQGMDSNGDGVITQQEAQAFQQQKIKNGVQPTSVAASALFLPKPGTWWVRGGCFGSVCNDADIVVASGWRGPGPNGQVVSAVQETGAFYYTSIDPYGKVFGFYNQAYWNGNGGYDPYAAAPTAPAPTTTQVYEGATLDYVDAQLWWEKSSGGLNPRWQPMLPANIPLNRWIPYRSASYNALGIWDPYGNPIVMVKAQDAFDYRVSLVTTQTGKPYLFAGRYPVYRLELRSWVTTMTPTPQCDPQIVNPQTLNDPNASCNGPWTAQGGGGPFYAISGLGILVMASPNTPVQQALASVQFGRVITDAAGNFVNITLDHPQARDPYGWSMPNLTTLKKWVAYLWKKRAQFFNGRIQPQGQQQAQPASFTVQVDAYGMPVGTPQQPVDAYGIPQPIKGQMQATAKLASYAAPNNETFWFELRTGTGQTVAGPMQATLTPTGGVTANLAATLTIPAQNQPTWVDLWLVMKDANGQTVVQQQPLASYLIQ